MVEAANYNYDEREQLTQSSLQESITEFKMPSTETLIKNAYYATGGFEDGTYLVKHRRELEDNYKRRKNLAYYYNFFAAIVDALVDPVFKKTASRDWSGGGSNFVKLFLEDVDCKGSNMQSFAQQYARASKLYGICYIVVDNFDSVPAMVSDMLAERKMPYAYIVEPSAVQNVKFDRFGNVLEFAFVEKDGDKDRTLRFDAEGFEIQTESGTVTGLHSLKRAPVIAVRSRITSDKNPPSEFNALVRIALNMYNMCSYLTEILGGQAFNILTYPSLQAQDLAIGVNNALGYDGENSSHAPEFIAPDSAPANTLIEDIKLMSQEMYRLSNLSFMTGSRVEASGESKKWDFERTNQALGSLARTCESTERQIVKLFCLWLNIDCNYKVSYPNELGIVDTKVEIEIAQMVIDLGLSLDLKIEVLKKILNVYLPELQPDIFDELIKAAQKELIAAKEDTTYKDVNGNEPPAE